MSYLSYTSYISFFRETLCSNFFCYFLFCFVFFIFSYINNVFFPGSFVVRMHAFIFGSNSPRINVFFNDLLTLPHIPTTSKASPFMQASEHLGCISGPWRIVLLFLRDFDKHFRMLSLISGRFKFFMRSVCDARLFIDQN